MPALHLPEPDRAGFVDLNRTRLRVWEWGDPADPTIICLHGAYDHGRMWDEFAPRLAALAPGHRVVAPDLRGHGDSGRLPHGHAWAMTALDIGVLARQMAPVGVVGHSFGAGLAGYVAGVWPEYVRWVVNLDGLGPPGPDEDATFDLAQAAADSLSWAERTLLEPPRVYATIEEMVERRARTNVRLPRPWVEHLVHHGSTAAEGGFVWKADAAFRTGLPGEFDVSYLEAELALTTCPMLVLTGSEPDTWSDHSPEEVAKRLAAYPNPHHEVIEGAGHYVHIEQPHAVLDAIGRFLAAIGGER
jgi:pimeloyl-ACP methyl ester carboxylesterase